MLALVQEEVIMICLARKDKGGLLTDLSMLVMRDFVCRNFDYRVAQLRVAKRRIEMMVI